MLPQLCFTTGTVLGRCWVVPGFLQTWCLELKPNSSSDQKILFFTVSFTECPLGAFLQEGFHVFFTEESLLFGHSAIKPRSMECWLSSISTKDLWSSARVTIGFLVTPLTKAVLPQLLSLARHPGCSKLLPFKNYGGDSALGNLQCSRIILVSTPRTMPRNNPISMLMKIIYHPGHGNSKCHIVGNWTRFSFLTMVHHSSKKLLQF